uniref:Transmembrane protein n=1 Tax=Chromera velia CCMP2878 TaxID=1169474 RepID=A0A0G4FQA9_9ALVE|mmetsp:Transcript_26910/g.52837  ORF Transcript_26910/g.52837 Transcript_26910/m.52837 type:complete len:255 (+) Transcript_26910:168-932(+)|eukprot:Cvel_3624.t1-p1 / transcript=Cvel_3624.t1 / gene=Cvel_3624 / organism=Chromera_velia_CCMP2878 / gene_product=hypothetical protein / transcript_product=hypothetical protein / location=Cvel_scaffold149:806-1567(+) / protein_length=254 / sequence_SO=supercontig / SO=protein_coding / is_pseudo=false
MRRCATLLLSSSLLLGVLSGASAFVLRTAKLPEQRMEAQRRRRGAESSSSPSPSVLSLSLHEFADSLQGLQHLHDLSTSTGHAVAPTDLDLTNLDLTDLSSYLLAQTEGMDIAPEAPTFWEKVVTFFKIDYTNRKLGVYKNLFFLSILGPVFFIGATNAMGKFYGRNVRRMLRTGEWPKGDKYLPAGEAKAWEKLRADVRMKFWKSAGKDPALLQADTWVPKPQKETEQSKDGQSTRKQPVKVGGVDDMSDMRG